MGADPESLSGGMRSRRLEAISACLVEIERMEMFRRISSLVETS